MAEQNKGDVALSIIEQVPDSTANTSSNPAAEIDQNKHPAVNTNDHQVDVAYIIWYYLIVPVLVLIIASIIAITVLPLLLPLYFLAHVVQVFWSTDDEDKLGKFMGFLAKWLCICFVLISIDLLICMLIFGVTPTLKGRIDLDVPNPKDPKVHDKLSVTRLIGVLAIICVFLSYSTFTRYLLGYRRLKKKPGEEEKNRLYEALIGTINSLLYLLALFSVTRVAPVLKNHKDFGDLPTYNWIGMILIVLFGHHAIRVITCSIVVALRNNCFMKGAAGKDGLTKVQGYEQTKKFLGFIEPINTGQQATSTEEWINHAAYYAAGLRESINFLLTSLMVLLTWILYLGIHLDQAKSSTTEEGSHTNKEVYHLGVLTFACISGGAFLWLVKCGIILSWKARLVHGKLYNQVSRAADQLYLIGIIAGPKLDILGVWKKGGGGGGDDDGEEQGSSTSNDQINPPAPENRQGSADGNISAGKQNAKLNVDRAKSRAREILVREENKGILPTSRIMRMAGYFLDAEKPLSRDGYLSEFVEHFWKNNRKPIKKIRDLHGDEIDEVDNKLFEKHLEGKMDDIETWIRTNHQVCLKVGRTLAGAMEVVDCLNNITITVLVAALTIVWLLISGIEITKVLVLIASPLLTASFIFGKSAANLFQGLVFIFVTRPFDVGDFCTINNVQLEVKRIGVSKTQFSKVGAMDDDVVYPNTILARTSIVTHNSMVDPNDHVELRLDSSTSMAKIKELKTKIREYIRQAGAQKRFYEHPNGVLMKDLGKTIGISVYFKHDEESIKAAMPNEALQNKTRRRNELLLQVKTILEELKIGESRAPQSPGSQPVVRGGTPQQNKDDSSNDRTRQTEEEKQGGTQEDPPANAVVVEGEDPEEEKQGDPEEGPPGDAEEE